MLAVDLYAALQANFRLRLLGNLAPEITDSEFITTADKNARNSDLGDLPVCLRTVPAVKIREALQGNDPTLGSCVVAFLLMSDDDTLGAIADSQPTFINDIADVIIKRGHGNEPLRLSKADIAKLRKASYKTIKTLIEV